MSTKIFEESYPGKMMYYLYAQPQISFFCSQDKPNSCVKTPEGILCCNSTVLKLVLSRGVLQQIHSL